MKIKNLFSIVFFSMLLSGCGINASYEKMTYTPQSKQNQKPINKNLANAITVKDVKGGNLINPLTTSEISNGNFKSALQQSLKNTGLLSQSTPAKYSLRATIVRLERPVLGLNFKSTLIVDYKLINLNKHTTVFHKTITGSYTAKMSDALVAVIRLKLANEGAARENIKQLTNELRTVR